MNHYEQRWINLFKPELNRMPGRPKGTIRAEPTKVIRVPVSVLPEVDELISKAREQKQMLK
jgi:hypothetical protein